VARTRWGRLLWVVAVLVAAGVLTTTIATDVHARARDRQEHTDLVRAQRTLSATEFDLRATTYTKDGANNHRNELEGSIVTTLGSLGTTDKSLAGTNAEVDLLGVGIGTLQTCLGGVQSSYQQIGGNNPDQAARDISAVSGACLTAAGGTTDGLVYPFDFPDPDVILAGNTYFAYATNSVAGNIQIIESNDLTHWTAVGNALPSLPAWAAPDATWAPGVAHLGNAYVMYYAVDVGGGQEECISEASAAQPQGPFIDTSKAPLVCQTSLSGSIDPFPFIDTDGKIYLVWKSQKGPTMIWSEQLNSAGTAFAAHATPTQLLKTDAAWQQGVVEGPNLVVTSAGRYFLFYSGNRWDTSDYGVGVATCAGPTGPCTNVSSVPLLSSGPGMDGPGGESVFAGPTGAYWIAFHAWIPGAVGYPHSRDLFIRPINLSGPVPVVGPAG
jgi:Glycosyl hydrolases family 43